jgi:hypothetical protein
MKNGHYASAGPVMSCHYIPEPLLSFAGDGEHVDPKTGILRFGPKSLKPAKRHPFNVRIGIIGSAETIEQTRKWLDATSEGVAGDDKHLEFPGFKHDRGFHSDMAFDDAWLGQLNHSEIDEVLEIRSARWRFEAVLKLLESKLDLLTSKDQPPEYIILALPDDLYSACRVAKYKDSDLGLVHRDLRRAFKSIAMKYRVPTQLLRQPTIDGRDKDKPSKIAWNFFTGLYFKAGGLPWGPTGLVPGSCYIGIGFYRPLGSSLHTLQTSLVQAFDEHGNGLVLRGHDFIWDPDKEGTAAPHLKEGEAFRLIDLVLTRYKDEMHQTPQRVVVHKSSRFWPNERLGFKAALRDRVSRYDLVALSRQSTVRALPVSQYPVLRGTHVSVGSTDYLYTTGFIAELGQFHGTHVPSPVQIADHVGHDTPREVLLREILTLTKMNTNSSRLGGSLPITLRFSQLVGDIMREIPKDRDPLPNFKFYI